nr:unnamed protein product [Callosobruchus chinensis]
MEPNYRNDDTSKKFEAITKKGKKLTTIRLNRKELKNQIKKDKINNLKTLLSLYDVNWQLDEKLSFFKEVLENDISQTTVLQPELQDEECDCNEDDGGVVI